MRFLKTILAAAAFAAVAGPASVALAQPSQTASVIVIDYERIIATSDVGRDMTAKLQAIATQMQGEVGPEQTSLEAEQTSIQQATQGMTGEQVQGNAALNTRVQQFAQRLEALRARQIGLARDLEFTRQRTLQDFNTQITPIVQEVMTSRNAGVVIDASVAQLYAPTVNATDDVISRLNQRLRTMNVTRQSAPAQQPGQ